MTSINSKIFKSYDIRGIYPDELNEEAAYNIGRALARKANAEYIVVGRDMRLSGAALKEKLIAGITDEGTGVLDIGLVPIDAVYFAVGILGHGAGVMITASHNPKEYNGFKMVLKGMNFVRVEELKNELLNLPELSSNKKGEVREQDLMDGYLNHVLSFVELKKLKPFKVVVDAGNGMAGKVMPLLAPHLPIEMIPLNFELDGNFPAHPSNPLLPESQVQITKAVVENKADFGVIIDGDTDRLFFVDETGQFVRADFALLILAREFLNREPGKGIVYNVVCSKIVPEKISEWGGVPLRSKVGYIYISAMMRENDGIMGGEFSAHYSFRDNAFADSGFIALLILLQLISQDGRRLSEIIGEFNKYFKTDEINLPINDRETIINKIKDKYRTGKQDELDGLTVEYENWWFNVRGSNTEPLLRVTVEAATEELLNSQTAELVDFVKANI
ncbi:MAG: phosphomannomutase/phosphoglucomutase [Patescibacteria group bacterium]|nr:phosphomannomutase/phosphoglucomutase [Patescibacteria group bacterium]